MRYELTFNVQPASLLCTCLSQLLSLLSFGFRSHRFIESASTSISRSMPSDIVCNGPMECFVMLFSHVHHQTVDNPCLGGRGSLSTAVIKRIGDVEIQNRYIFILCPPYEHQQQETEYRSLGGTKYCIVVRSVGIEPCSTLATSSQSKATSSQSKTKFWV